MLGQVLGGVMSKVAVGRSVAHAYGFVFGRIFAVLGIAWMGAVLYAGLARIMIHQIPAMQALREASLAGHAAAALWHLPIVLVLLLIVASIAIPLTREALGEGGEFVFAQFVLGARELRYFLALIRLGVIVIAVLAAGAFALEQMPAAARLLAAHWPQIQPTLDQWPVVAGLQAGVCAGAMLLALVLVLRFGFLLRAVAAVEHRASLTRAWALSRGNTLRILMVVLLTAIPAYILLFAIAYALLGQPLFDAYREFLAAGAAQPGAALLALYGAHGAAFAGLAALKMLLLVGLMAGASAEAYRTLTADGGEGTAQESLHNHDDGAQHHHEEHHHDDHQGHAPAQSHHEDHDEHAVQAAEDVGQDGTGHEELEHHAQEPAYEEPAYEEPAHEEHAREEPAHGDHVPHAAIDAGARLDDEPVQYYATAPEPAPPADQYQHDDDETCDCQVHAVPAQTHDDPHDAHAIELEPGDAARLGVAAAEPVMADEPAHSDEDENVLVLEPA